ncbi:MAG TPA: FecR domain-containing protein, partial [Chitinophagaceae bacterium]|nr:FecR domain-containing protein [Chitinophagaceae bacterium]
MKVMNGELRYDTLAGPRTNELNTLETPRGGQYAITLEDGTKVFLNTLTSLKFPGKFSAAKRTVWLSGEAHFEVHKDTSRPFVVITPNQEIRVTGTKFIVSAYQDERFTATTVEEGSVEVTNRKGDAKPKIALIKGQAAVYDTITRELKPDKHANVDAARSFVNGKIIIVDNALIVNGATLSSVMKQVSRWYDVTVKYAPGFNPDEIIMAGIFFDKGQTLPEILKVLKDLHVSVRVEQKTLFVDRLK